MKRTALKTIIRDYRKEDFPMLIELWKITDMSDPERDDSPESIQSCNARGGKLLIMEDMQEGRMIGSSWMTNDGRRTYLHHFCIHPEYREMGLGTELAERSMDWIRKKGNQVKLEVHKKNIPAKNLYEKLGFFAFREYDIYMKRDLS